MAERKVGVVIHYWSKVGVAGVRITDGELSVGDTIHVKGHTSDFTQTIESMQIENRPVETARAGDEIGMKVADHAREHDEVLKVVPD